MPIIAKSFVYVRPRPNGRVRVREHHESDAGFHFYYSHEADSEAAATTKMNSRDLTVRLQDLERDRLRAWISEGKLLDDFVWFDIPLARRRATRDEIVAELDVEIADLDTHRTALVSERDILDAP